LWGQKKPQGARRDQVKQLSRRSPNRRQGKTCQRCSLSDPPQFRVWNDT